MTEVSNLHLDVVSANAIATNVDLNDIDALIAAAEQEESAQKLIDEAKKAALDAQAELDEANDEDTGEAVSETTVNITPVFEEGDIHQMRKSVDGKTVEKIRAEVTAQFDQRTKFHADNDPHNTNIQKNLAKYRQQFSSPHTAGVIAACKMEVSFINRVKRGEQCFNVYSVEKVSKLINQIVLGVANNAYNDAIFKSMWNFMKAKVPFTTEAAKAAISDQIAVKDKQIKALLVRHNVKPGTASTQSSSSLRAMEVLGIVRNAGTEGRQVWVLNDNPQTRAVAASYGLN